jgi:hypothetical protein
LMWPKKRMALRRNEWLCTELLIMQNPTTRRHSGVGQSGRLIAITYSSDVGNDTGGSP